MPRDSSSSAAIPAATSASTTQTYRATEHLAAGNTDADQQYRQSGIQRGVSLQRDSQLRWLSPQAHGSPETTSRTLRRTRAANVAAIENNYSAGGTGLFNSDSWTARGDYTLNEKMHAFERFSRFCGYAVGQGDVRRCGRSGIRHRRLRRQFQGRQRQPGVGHGHCHQSKLLTDFRLGYYRYNVIDYQVRPGRRIRQHPWHPRHQHRQPVHRRRAGIRYQLSRSAGNTSRVRRRPEHQPLQLPADRDGRPVPDRQQLDQGLGQPHPQDWRRPALRPQPARAVRHRSCRTDELRRPVQPQPTGTNGLGWATFVHGRGDQLRTLRFHLHQCQGVPEADLLLRTGHLARYHEPDPEPRSALGALLPRER